MTDSTTTHNIVILGASFSGLRITHGILKGIPTLQSQTKKTYRVTLVANNSHC